MATGTGSERGGDEGKVDEKQRGNRWLETAEEQWRRIREHAETYPYVWASYILVYGGVGIYTTYRWRKLRKTEARVKVLHERLKKLVEADEAAASAEKKGS